MKDNNKKALIVAYYLSKYDREALKNLGYETFENAFNDTSIKLSVNKHTVKNMRDEFDPIHNNNRKGWYQRELIPSKQSVVNKFSYLSELALREIVKSILSEQDNCEIESILQEIDTDNDRKNSNNTRSITGKKAEEVFEEYFNKNIKKNNVLINTSSRGCGYDYETSDDNSQVYEVKGSKDECINILLTDKEWDVASKLKERYNLVLVSYVYGEYKVKIINNPYHKFKAKKVIEKIITMKWTINVQSDSCSNE